MLYLHIILLKRRLDLEGGDMMKGLGVSTLKFVQIKTGLKYHWIVLGMHGCGNERTPITEVFTDTG